MGKDVYKRQSLDYSIRKQILHLLNELQEKYEMTYLLITHDLSNVPYLCKEVAIMYQGRVVELSLIHI